MTPIMPDHPTGASDDDTRSSVKARLTPNRPRRSVENDEYGAFVRRILRAYSRRVGDGDVEALVLLVDLAEEIDTAMAEAVKGLRAHGYSWAEIGSRLGITRQAVSATLGDHIMAPERARCVPDRTVKRGHTRLLTDTGAHGLTASQLNRRPRTRSLPSWS